MYKLRFTGPLQRELEYAKSATYIVLFYFFMLKTRRLHNVLCHILNIFEITYRNDIYIFFYIIIVAYIAHKIHHSCVCAWCNNGIIIYIYMLLINLICIFSCSWRINNWNWLAIYFWFQYLELQFWKPLYKLFLGTHAILNIILQTIPRYTCTCTDHWKSPTKILKWS